MKPITDDSPAPLKAIPTEQMERLQTALSNLEAALLAQDPQMPHHLAASHRVLIAYPETVHLLDDAEIKRLIVAAQEHTRTQIVSEAAKGKGGTKKKVSVDDL